MHARRIEIELSTAVGWQLHELPTPPNTRDLETPLKNNSFGDQLALREPLALPAEIAEYPSPAQTAGATCDGTPCSGTAVLRSAMTSNIYTLDQLLQGSSRIS